MVATYNAIHSTTATTDFSVHADMAPNVYITGNPARDSATTRTLERTMSDIKVKNPLSGVTQPLFFAMADPVEQELLHMQMADPARTPTFTPFAQGEYFLNASSTTTCGTPANLDSCVFLPNTAPPASTFAWNHGGIQPEIANTWAGLVGPGVKGAGQDDALWSDHTDVRPTMLSVLGLTDSYVSDGRVLTDILKNGDLPKSLKPPIVEELGHAYKQIMASFGQLSADSLVASTRALASNASGDTAYAQAEAALASLTSDRDALAAKIRAALWNAEFADQPIDPGLAATWIEQANALLDRAQALAS